MKRSFKIPSAVSRTFLVHRLAFVFGLCVALPALADTSTVAVLSASHGSSNSPVTLTFPFTRSGDASYDAVLNYHTVDGSATAGLDYIAAIGALVIPAGATDAAIPVTLTANPSGGADQTFQLVLDSAVGVGPAPSFAVQQTLTGLANPVSIAIADINGDGLPDLVETSANSISVMLNTTTLGTATATFAAQQTLAGAAPGIVRIADINGDGRPDLIVTGTGSNNVAVMLNTTAPASTVASFAAPQTFATGLSPQFMAIADLNGDGKPDLVVANVLLDNTLSVLFNTTAPGAATPTFAAQQVFATGNTPRGVAIADINGDGLADLILANQADDDVSILLNTTAPGAMTPSFAAQQTFASGPGSFAVAVTDVNGDGKPDVLVSNLNSNTSTVSVLLNTTGTGASSLSFAPSKSFATGYPEAITVTDLNGDGRPDIVASNAFGSFVSVLLNTTSPGAGTPSFAAEQAIAAGVFVNSVAAADVNGDGKPDIAVALSQGTVRVLLNTTPLGTTPPNFPAHQMFAVGSDPRSVTAADLNGDGKRDLIVANYGDATVSVLLNTTAPGATTSSLATQQTFATGTNPNMVATADINGDGKLDLVVNNSTNTNTVSVLLNTTAPGAATPSFAAQQTFATELIPEAIATADVNRDGRPDVILANNAGSVSVLLNTTAPGAAIPSFAAKQTFSAGSASTSVTAADINGDGALDLIVSNAFPNTVSVLLNTTAPGASVLSFTAPQTFAAGSFPVSVAAADLNGDGRPDLIVAGDSIAVLLNTTATGATTSSFTLQQSFFSGTGVPSWVTATDVNGDGKLDVVAANYINTVVVLLNTTAPGTTTPSFAAAQTFEPGPIGASAVSYSAIAADINGDGLPDLVAANARNNNSVSILLNTQYQVSTNGSPATGTIVHDYIFANGFE